MKHHIYLAGPLFTHGERAYLSSLRDQLRRSLPSITVTWPGDLFDADHLANLGPAAKEYIFKGCRDAIHAATHVVALLDGTQVDDGTAWEIGYAYARGLPIIGLRTDFRQAGDTAHSVANAMIECSCLSIVRSAEELLMGLTGIGDITQE
ncbi:nucleoside 2-deoxyribosyltransferase [Solidesulfovibrio sp.]